MFKENVLNGLSWLSLTFRTVWATNPRDPRDVTPFTTTRMDYFARVNLEKMQCFVHLVSICCRNRSITDAAVWLATLLTIYSVVDSE